MNNFRIQTTSNLVIRDSGKACFDRGGAHRYTLTPGELAGITELRKGVNTGLFVIEDLGVRIGFKMYLFDQRDKFVISDVDGTITESDMRGHVLPHFGSDADHDDVVKLYHKIGRNGYNLIYLTARSIAMDGTTREYLFEV